MKKILITGANSYIGTSFERWLRQWIDKYSVDTVDMRDNTWKDTNFSEYNVVFHVAGIAHKKETKKNQELYYTVNRDLAYQVAQKAKENGVKQFIFLSSMGVYGIEEGIIDKDSETHPKNNYGKSKLQAERLLMSLMNNEFKLAIIRPPMIYGNGCKGNYPKLAKFALHLPVFPDIINNRSMIYIDNICEFVRVLIDDCSKGLFFPQNEEYVRTSEMVRLIAQAHGKKIKLTKVFNPIVDIFKFSTINKVFGNLVYDKSLSLYDKKYNLVSFEKSIYNTEV